MISHPSRLRFQEIQEYLNSHSISSDDKNESLRKYHILNRKHQAYKMRLQATFRQGYQMYNRNDFLEIGHWLAEIYYFDPCYSETFSFIHEQFYSKTMANVIYSKEKESSFLYIDLAAKLIQPQQIQALLIQAQMLSNSLSANAQEVLKKFAVIQSSIRWEIYWKAYYLKTKSQRVLVTIEHIFKNFQQSPQYNSEKVIMGKSSLINACLDYFLSGQSANNKFLLKDQSLTLKNIVVGQIWKCQASFPQFQENQKEILDLLLKSVKLYGVYDEQRISKMLSKNEHKIGNMVFLQILKEFLSSTNKLKISASEIMNSLVSKALDSIFSPFRKSFCQNFKIIKVISDIIIRAFSFCTFNFTKQITHRLKALREDYHRKFLTTLLLIYNSKLQKQLMNAIIPDLQKVFYQNQCFLPYDKMIKSFGSLDFNIIDYASDPEKKDEELMWELLTLRNAIKVDYKSLSQNNFVYGIYRNLLKFIFCNIFWSQCSEIILEICSYKQGSENWLGDLNFYELIQEVIAIEIPCLGALKSIAKILVIHKQTFLGGNFTCLSLFVAVCELVRRVINKNGPSQQLTNVAVQFLRISLPETFDMISDQMLFKAQKSLIKVLLENSSKEFFNVYLDFMYLARNCTSMQQKLAKDSGIVKYITNNQEIESFSLDKFEILDYMINKNRFQLHIVDKIWDNIKTAISSQQKDIFLYFIQIFEYFGTLLETNARIDQNQRTLFFMFLKDQTLKTMTIIDQIYVKIDEIFLVENLNIMLQTLQGFQVSLYKYLIQIQKYDQATLMSSFYDLPNLTSKWFKKLEEYQQFQCFKEDKRMIRKLWNCCYLSLMLITCLSYRMCQNPYDYSFSYETMRQKLNHSKTVLRNPQKIMNQCILQYDKILTQECRFVVSNSRFSLK